MHHVILRGFFLFRCLQNSWIINNLLDILTCSTALHFYSLFVFWLALWAQQSTARLINTAVLHTKMSNKIYFINLIRTLMKKKQQQQSRLMHYYLSLHLRWTDHPATGDALDFDRYILQDQ